MVLAILLLICAGFTAIATVFTMAIEINAGKRALTLVFSTLYVVVMVLSALALMR